MRIGLIGVGVVGYAVYRAFSNKFNVIGYDKQGDFANEANFQEVLSSDLIFICVPSPTYDGKQDLTILESVINRLKENKFTGVVCIKCTVIPGTTNRLKRETNLRLTHNPEFLTAAKPYEDFMNQEAIIIGGEINDTKVVAEAYGEILSVPCIEYFDATITETAKYMRNVYLAMKVAFANEIYEVCEKLGIPYEVALEATMSQGGIEPKHFRVPGPDGKRGYSGMCFPKDVRALGEFMRDENLNCHLIRSIEESNQVVRPHDIMCKETT